MSYVRKKSIGGVTHFGSKRALGVDGLVAMVKYKGVAKEMISKLKYRYVKDMNEDIVEIVLSMGNLEAMSIINGVAVEVPLHAKRERWRGFNQAKILA